MVDEEKHPRAEPFKRRHGGGEALFGCGELFDFAAVDSFDEVVASWKVAIKSLRCQCPIGVRLSSRLAAAPSRVKTSLATSKDTLAIALRVGAGLACGRDCESFSFFHTNNSLKLFANGSIPGYIILRGLSPFYKAKEE